MNLAFFLTPKEEVEVVRTDDTVRQALERMEAHSYSAVPLLDDGGRYVGTITEGDLLWFVKHAAGSWREVTEGTSVLDVVRHVNHQPVHINVEMEALVTHAIDQNFVPVVDDRDVFVGIVRRRRIIEYCARLAGLLPER